MSRYFKDITPPQALSGVIENIVDTSHTGLARGMVLKIYKSKLLKVIDCVAKRADIQLHAVPFRFNTPDFAKGYRLAAPGAKIPLTAAQKHRRSHLLSDLQDATLRPQDPSKPGYKHPVLVIRFAPGSMWTTEINMQRYQLLQLLNGRLKRDFLKDLKVK